MNTAVFILVCITEGIKRFMDSKGEVLLTIMASLHSGAKRKKRVYSSKYALSSIVYCPKCGEIYRRIAWNNRGKSSIVW